MHRMFLLFAMLVAMTGAVAAQVPDEADRSAFRRIIAAQIEAFRADDGAAAYDHAAPVIKRIFPTPEHFMAMVRRGYQPVYRPRSYSFAEAGFDAAGRPIQRVEVIGPDGLSYEAIYTMERQPDGRWKISGCRLVRTADLST